MVMTASASVVEGREAHPAPVLTARDDVLERIRAMDFKAVYGEANYQKLADDLEEIALSVQPDSGGVVDERLKWFLKVIEGAGGEVCSTEHRQNPINVFCDDRDGDDTFNISEAAGYTQTSHDTSFDTSTTRITDKGRAYLSILTALAPVAAEGGEKQDAERFRALMRCGRIKMQGSSGVDPHTGERNGNNVHFGAEFWPEPIEPEWEDTYRAGTTWGRACLKALADAILEQEAALRTEPTGGGEGA